jgi:hypothetical protein
VFEHAALNLGLRRDVRTVEEQHLPSAMEAIATAPHRPDTVDSLDTTLRRVHSLVSCDGWVVLVQKDRVESIGRAISESLH